ncbi:hypothetical protein [Dermacoccus nishinomiyaensis]|nr:hypothetical protein [Dermacoccus nishinomiyaensis]
MKEKVVVEEGLGKEGKKRVKKVGDEGGGEVWGFAGFKVGV